MSGERGALPGGMSCDDAAELAGLYVLGALERDEEARVAAHLAACPEPHPEFAELGAAVPALAAAVEPIDAPADLRRRVLDAYERDNVPADVPRRATDAPTAAPVPWQIPGVEAPRRGFALPQWLGWAAAAAAVLVLAVVGVWALGVQQRANAEEQRSQVMADALAVLAQPDSSFALLQGTGPAAGVSGFVAFPAEGEGYMVMTNLPPAPEGMIYQAWYVVDGQPASAGTINADSDGFAVAEGLPTMEGTDLMAVTIEPAGGSPEPTTDPIIVGEMVTRA